MWRGCDGLVRTSKLRAIAAAAATAATAAAKATPRVDVTSAPSTPSRKQQACIFQPWEDQTTPTDPACDLAEAEEKHEHVLEADLHA